MPKLETVSLRIFGRDLTLSCPANEKDNLLEASKLFNEELDSINDKNNALIIAGLSLANKLLLDENISDKVDNKEIESLIKKIDSVL
jgi:cell division protein ZapA (FtsZ GTPase activity inhibitor)